VLRAVPDTNVFVSNLLVKEGQPSQILDAWQERRLLLAVSPPLISEIRSTLKYPHIRSKYGITDLDVEQLITLLEHDALVVPGTTEEVAGVIPDDPADEMVLACAVETQADFIVSGDRHLLDLHEHKGIPILTVREFLERLATEPET
jgi:putative PIN family toxin of toxin-antitoxin system